MSKLNWNSRNLTRGWQRGVTAFFYGLGMSDADFDKPQIGIGVPLLERDTFELLCLLEEVAVVMLCVVIGTRIVGIVFTVGYSLHLHWGWPGPLMVLT